MVLIKCTISLLVFGRNRKFVTLNDKTSIMSALTLDLEINKYLPLLEKEEKQSLLSQIKSFLSAKETPKRMTRDEFII